MVCAGVKSLLLVFLLSVTADAINPGVLAENIRFARNRIALSGEYAFLITTTPDVCSNSNRFQTALQGQLDQIYHSFVTENTREIVQTPNIIAARPNHDIHAERWVLFYYDGEAQRRTQNPNTCVLFFTTYSPCLERCSSPNHAESIITTLQRNQLFRNINANLKAFVFYTIYRDDESRLQQLRQAFNTIEQYMPVFRCTSFRRNGRETNICYKCATQMTDCLWVP